MDSASCYTIVSYIYKNIQQKQTMDKPALTSQSIHPIIKKRWSPRAFSSKPITKDQLLRIFEAARWSPSSFNEQPWRFIAGVKGHESWDKLYECMVEFNQKWAGKAPILLLSVGKKTSTNNGKPNGVYQYDVGQSMAYITFQVMEEGLRAHQMGGFSKDKARELFSIPDDYEPIAMMAVGYQDEPDTLSPDFEDMERAPRQRKALDELVFAGRFGKAMFT